MEIDDDWQPRAPARSAFQWTLNVALLRHLRQDRNAFRLSPPTRLNFKPDPLKRVSPFGPKHRAEEEKRQQHNAGAVKADSTGAASEWAHFQPDQGWRLVVAAWRRRQSGFSGLFPTGRLLQSRVRASTNFQSAVWPSANESA